MIVAYIGGRPPRVRLDDEDSDWSCDLIDHSDSGIQPPDPKLIEIHGLFANAFRWIDVEDKIQLRKTRFKRPPVRASSRSSFDFLKTALLALWLKVPVSLRVRTYNALKNIGLRWYGSTEQHIQRLPFGLYLKCPSDKDAITNTNEYNALRLFDDTLRYQRRSLLTSSGLMTSHTLSQHAYLGTSQASLSTSATMKKQQS